MVNLISPITTEEISDLVDKFYAKVQQDQTIGPIFNEAVENWPAHLALLKDFWSTVLLTSATYKGNPMLTHLKLDLKPEHFRRWLELFAQTAREVMPPEHAQIVIEKSERIAQNFRAAIAQFGPNTLAARSQSGPNLH